MSHEVELTPDRLRQELREISDLETELLKVFAERTATPARISDLFRRLNHRATAHFYDEAIGVLHEAAERNEHLKDQCNSLCANHATLRCKLDQLLEKSESADCTPQWWDQMEKEFKALALELTRHEELEEPLIDAMDQPNK